MTPLAKVGNRIYDSLEEAIKNASNNDVITLISNVELNNTITIDKPININLNGKTISADEKVFLVKGGVLDITGSGIIKEVKPNYGAIMVIGKEDETKEKYSVVNVGENVILEGWSGIFINHENSKSYGVYVNMNGKINSVNDLSGSTGIGIYVNGNIKDSSSSPIVNIGDDAEIISSGNGLYIAGYSTFNIGKAYIKGNESGIGIKSGILNINGAHVVCDGADKTPTEGYNNGIKPSGATIQIESNNGYAGDIEINISNGNFESKNSNVIYEYIGKGNQSLINSMSISGGIFKSGDSKDVFSLSNSFKDIHSGFISGGEYSTDPSNYLKNGYSKVNDGNMYKVIKSTLKNAGSNSISESGSNGFIKSFLIIIGMTVVGIFIYLNRLKFIRIIKNIKS